MKKDQEIIEKIDQLQKTVEGTKDKILNFTEAATYLRLSKSYLYKLTSRKEIPHLKPGGKLVYFRQSDLDKWLLQRPVASRSQIEQQVWKSKNGRPQYSGMIGVSR